METKPIRKFVGDGKFDQLLEQIKPIVFANVPGAVSVGCAKEIAEDITYLILHGYTVEICKQREHRQ